MVWRFACTAPQIHIMSDRGASRSRVNTVMSACTEAKSVGLALKLDYFRVSTQTGHADSAVPEPIKCFVNRDVDTFWLIPSRGVLFFPNDIEWFCGECNLTFDRIGPEPCNRCMSISGCTIPEGIQCLALDFMKWTEPDDDDLPIGTMELCQLHDVKELLLVVGDYAMVQNERDVALVAPSQRPWLTYLHLSRELKVPETRGLQILESAMSTWQELEESLARQAEEIKVQRAKDRQEAVDCKYTCN
jgi:hypothetical protein